MKFKLTIEPSISPRTRNRIGDVLEKAGYTIIGAGQAIDGKFSDISFEKDDARDC